MYSVCAFFLKFLNTLFMSHGEKELMMMTTQECNNVTRYYPVFSGVVVAYKRWSLTRGSKYINLTCKLLGLAAALVRSYMNGLKTFENTIEQTTETVLSSHKTTVAAGMIKL